MHCHLPFPVGSHTLPVSILPQYSHRVLAWSHLGAPYRLCDRADVRHVMVYCFYFPDTFPRAPLTLLGLQGPPWLPSDSPKFSIPSHHICACFPGTPPRHPAEPRLLRRLSWPRTTDLTVPCGLHLRALLTSPRADSRFDLRLRTWTAFFPVAFQGLLLRRQHY